MRLLDELKEKLRRLMGRDNPPASEEPYAFAGVPAGPRRPLRSGAIALPEPDDE